jgi:hypothetical protein
VFKVASDEVLSQELVHTRPSLVAREGPDVVGQDANGAYWAEPRFSTAPGRRPRSLLHKEQQLVVWIVNTASILSRICGTKEKVLDHTVVLRPSSH